MSRLFALIATLLLLGAAPAARDWSTTVSRTTAGAYVIGNPQAKVKLVEYLSYTCPHCADFSVESSSTLKGGLVRSGSTSVELRHAIRDEIDLAAAVVARCAGAKAFFGASEAIFAQQKDWYPRGLQFESANAQRMTYYSDAQKLRALADGAGLTDLARTRGLSDPALDACFADKADLERIALMADAAWAKISGTPTFELNGATVDHVNWALLEPKLRAAGAK